MAEEEAQVAEHEAQVAEEEAQVAEHEAQVADEEAQVADEDWRNDEFSEAYAQKVLKALEGEYNAEARYICPHC